MVEEPGSRPADNQCMFQGFFHQRCFQGPTDRPADDFATTQIHNPSQINPARYSPHVSDISHPGQIGSARHLQLLKSIGSHRFKMPAVGCARSKRPLLPGADTMELHQAGHPVLAAKNILSFQLPGDPWTAVGSSTQPMRLPNTTQQLIVGTLPRPRNFCAPSIVTAAPDLERLAKSLNRKFPGQLGNHGIPPCSGSVESMPRDFFKISLCCRKASFSLLSLRFSCSRTVRLI